MPLPKHSLKQTHAPYIAVTLLGLEIQLGKKQMWTEIVKKIITEITIMSREAYMAKEGNEL